MELLIALRVGELNIPNFEGLAEFVKNASKAMEEAQEALKRHTAEHGCCAPLALMHKAAEEMKRKKK